MAASSVAAVTGPTPVKAAHEACLARQRGAGLDVRGDLGCERRQCLAQAGDVRLEAAPHAGMARVREPVALGDQHLLHLITPGLQCPERHQLGRRRRIQAQPRGVAAVEGQHPGIDRIGLGGQAEIAGKMADAGSVCLVHREPECDADRQYVALVAAGGLADDEEWPAAGRPVAPHLVQQALADRRGRVGDGVLPVVGQNMNRQRLLSDLECDNVIEGGGCGVHSPARSVILDCMRPSQALLPFGWTRNLARRVKDSRGPCQVHPGHDRSPPVGQDGRPARRAQSR